MDIWAFLTVRSHLVPGMGGGSFLGRLSHKGCQKNVYVFLVYWFFGLPNQEASKDHFSETPSHLLIILSEEENPPPKSTQNKKVHLNMFFEQFALGS